LRCWITALSPRENIHWSSCKNMSSQITFRLVIHDLTGGERIVEIPPGTLIIGRQVGAGLVLDQQKVSRQHAKIECDGQDCFITDLQSANGTRLDGKKIQPLTSYRLHPGASINIGDYSIIYEQLRVEVPEAPEEDDLVITSQDIPLKVDEAQVGDLKTPIVEPDGDSEHPEPELPPPPIDPPSSIVAQANPNLPGMAGESRFFIKFLPEIYQNEFMARFLAIFESILLPIEWNIDNFDLYLSPRTAPRFFLTWLASWFGLFFDTTWTEDQRRIILAEGHSLYAMRGTRWALSRMLEIYTGEKPLINDTGNDLKPHTFTVRISGRQKKASQKFIERIIEENKPAHTTFVLEIEE
jgi:phage tail-like protein